MTSVEVFGHTSRDAYTDWLSFDWVYLEDEKIYEFSYRIGKETYHTCELVVSFWYFHGILP